MAILQHSFNYEGDALALPIKQIGLTFQIPTFEYELTELPDSNNRKIASRTLVDNQFINSSQALQKASYERIIPNQFLIANDDSAFSFWSYLIESKFRFRGDSIISSDDPTILSYDIPVQFADEAKNSFGQLPLNALISLALSSATFGQIVLDPPVQTDQPNPALLRKLYLARIAYVKENIILINKNSIDKLVEQAKLLGGNINEENVYSIVPGLVALLTEIIEARPKIITEAAIASPIITKFLQAFGLKPSEISPLLLLVPQFKDTLFDFPISVPTIETTSIAGTFKIQSAQNLQLKDFKFYDLFAEYSIQTFTDTQKLISIHFDWNTKESGDIEPDNTIHFAFAPIIRNAISGSIAVRVKSFNGEVLFAKNFGADEQALQEIAIVVEVKEPALFIPPVTPVPSTDVSKKLSGKVIQLGSSCSLKDLTIVVQAKTEGDSLFRIVGAGTTDGSGNFSMPYPFGLYVEAQAIVSLTPDSPADISINKDIDHVNLKQTISDDFLFLLIKDVDCPPKIEDDCDCHSTKQPNRLPSQEDLIASNEYAQDIGGSCINLTTPNRTLSEYSFSALVRTSDPDVSNYVLKKIEEEVSDPANVGQTIKITKFNLEGGQATIVRKPVGLGNPILWQDAPDNHENLSIYQAVSVATGHILHYKMVTKADGYSMGELLYSLPLAPGQKKEIVIFDSEHTLQAAETQQVSQSESLASSLLNERSITDQLNGSINEAIRGRSSASTGGISAGLGLAGSYGGFISGVLGVSGGYSKASSTASQDSSRDVSQFFNEKLQNLVTQNAQSYRQLNASVITTVKEGQQYAVTTEVVANHNHCHSLTMMYFEVLRHYAIYQELASVEECLFIPLLLTNFSTENIYKWRDVLATNLLPMPSQTYLQPTKLIGVGLQHPLLKAFDANERIKTKYENVDFPAGSYDEEKIDFLKGYITIQLNFPRPKTRYDRVKSWPVVQNTTEGSHHLWGFVGGLLAGPIGVVVGGIFDSDGTVKLEVQAKIDEYIDIDANYASIPPANSIRIKKFEDNFFEDGIVDKSQWDAYASLLNYQDDGVKTGTVKMLEYYFKGRLVAEWDAIFYNDMAPVILEAIVNTITIDHISTDFTSTVKYTGGERLVRLNLRGSTNLARNQFPVTIKLFSTNQQVKNIGKYIKFIIGDLYIAYSTRHYNGILFSGYVGDDLLDLSGTLLSIPENSDEKRNPKKEDRLIVDKLIEHLNSNLEFYNRKLLENLDAQRRFMLLDGFNIETYDDNGQHSEIRSLASVVKNELVTIVGNSLVMPVAPGYKTDLSVLVEATTGGEETPRPSNLFDKYKPLTPIPPYRISVPSRGVFAEAVQGACDACEKVKDNTSQDWTKFTTDEPTAINPVTVPVPTITDWKAAIKDLATPIINIQNAPAVPAPGAGLAGLSELLGKSDVFKDITGLTENQKNAMQTYLSNQENVKALAEMAKEMQMQAHNTQNSDKIADSIRNSPELTKEQKAKLLNDHYNQMIDGGQGQKAEQENAKSDKLQNDISSNVDRVNNSKKGEVSVAKPDGTIYNSKFEDGANPGSEITTKIGKGGITPIKQPNDMACWATVATMMMRWKDNADYTIEDVLSKADENGKYLQLYQQAKGLPSDEKDDFITSLGMAGEPLDSYTVDQYQKWLVLYGPLWVTVDSDPTKGFSAHAQVITGISKDLQSIQLIDPGSNKPQPMVLTFKEFNDSFAQVITDGANILTQVVHFTDEIGSEGRAKKVKLFTHSGLSNRFHQDTGLFDDTPTFVDLATFDSVKDASLQAALEQVINTNPDFKANKDKIQLSIVNLNDLNDPLYAGWNDLKLVNGDSTAKVAAIYALFQLIKDVKDFFVANPDVSTKVKLIAGLKKFWGKGVNPNVTNLLKIPATITSDAEIVLNDEIGAKIFSSKINDEVFPTQLIRGLSFEYIASVIFQSGIFNEKTKGIWLTWDYGGRAWNDSPFKFSDNPPVNSLSFAIFYSLLAQGQLAFSQQIKDVLGFGCKTGLKSTDGTTVDLFQKMPAGWATASTTKISQKCGFRAGSADMHDTVLFQDAQKTGAIIILTETYKGTVSSYLNPDLFKALYDVLPNR